MPRAPSLIARKGLFAGKLVHARRPGRRQRVLQVRRQLRRSQRHGRPCEQVAQAAPQALVPREEALVGQLQ